MCRSIGLATMNDMRMIRKRTLIILIVLALTAALVAMKSFRLSETVSPGPVPATPEPENAVAIPGESGEVLSVPADVDGLVPPLPRASERVTKKTFGILIVRATSPVQPERFAGYHTGTDFEAFPEEENGDVSVSAICPGTLLAKRMADGYGGVAVQSCVFGNEPVTVVYGHLRLSSIGRDIGDEIILGETIGVLGAGYSQETDGERKHLHLGIRRGKEADIRGYVTSEGELSGWIDPCVFLCPEP